MKGAVQITRPDDVDVTITLTASLADWRQVYKDLGYTTAPACALRILIRDLVSEMQQSIRKEATNA